MKIRSDRLVILRGIDQILRENIAQRLPKLIQLRGQVKRIGKPFISILLESLCGYYEAREILQIYQASKGENTSYDEEVEKREKVIALLNNTLYDLEKARDMAKLQEIPENTLRKVESTIDWYTYLATNLDLRQRLILSMNDLEYSEAMKIAKKGLELAKTLSSNQKAVIANINFYAGHLKEIEAFEKFCDKRFWEITSNDFLCSSRLFDESVKILERVATKRVDLERLTSVSKAWSYLLGFIAKPSLENIEYLAKYRQLEESFPTVRRQFAIDKERNVSKRKLRAARMRAFLRDSVYKIACWNVFNELHFNVNLIESYINAPSRRELLFKIFEKAGMPKERLIRYSVLNEGNKLHLTYEYFINDVEEYLPGFLPLTIGKNDKPSLIIAKNLYHLCKHQKIQVDIFSPIRDQFTELFVDKILKEHAILKTLNLDRTRFLESLEKECVSLKEP